MSRKNKKALKNKVNNLLNPLKPFEKLIMDTIQTKYNEMLDDKLMNGSGNKVKFMFHFGIADQNGDILSPNVHADFKAIKEKYLSADVQKTNIGIEITINESDVKGDVTQIDNATLNSASLTFKNNDNITIPSQVIKIPKNMTNIEKQLPSPKNYEHGFVYVVVQLKDDNLIPHKPKIAPDDTVKTIEYHYININQERWGFLHSKTC